jgi:hypothetical protein
VSADRCAWPGCARGHRPGQLMCRGHWYALPGYMRDRIWASYVPGQNAITCTDEYRAALRAVLDYARQQNEVTR